MLLTFLDLKREIKSEIILRQSVLKKKEQKITGENSKKESTPIWNNNFLFLEIEKNLKILKGL